MRLDNTVNARAYQRVSNTELIREYLEVAQDPVEKALALAPGPEGDAALGGAEGNRVGDQVAHDLDQAVLGGVDHEPLARRKIEHQPRALGQGRRLMQLDQGGQVVRLLRRRQKTLHRLGLAGTPGRLEAAPGRLVDRLAGRRQHVSTGV